jgi:hypothetical protein
MQEISTTENDRIEPLALRLFSKQLNERLRRVATVSMHPLIFLSFSIIVSIACGCHDHRVAPQQKLSHAQTIRLANCYPFSGSGAKHHLFKLASPDSNAELVSRIRGLASSSEKLDSSLLVIGYTGLANELFAIQEILEMLSNKYDGINHVSGRDTRMIEMAFLAIGLQAKRDIPGAREYIEKIIDGNEKLLPGLIWKGDCSNARLQLLDMAFIAYALSGSPDLGSRFTATKQRMKQDFPRCNWYQTTEKSLAVHVEMIEALSSQSISSTERDALRY